MTQTDEQSGRRQVSRWLTTLTIGTALVIALAMGILSMPPKTVDLSRHERSVFSQNGEDGILEKIFELVEPTHEYAIEFGGGDGVKYSNVRNLFVNHGWSGLLIEGDEELAEKSAKAYANLPRVKSIQAWVWPGNVELLFEDNGVPRDPDLLVIDIDSNDWYVWRVLHDFRPKVVMVEFNGSFPPPEKVVVDFHPMNYWDKSDYYGASIQSYYELGKKKGYELVYCDSRGINLFFVAGEYYKSFGIADNSPAALYRPPPWGRYGRLPGKHGHPAWDLLEVVDPDTGESVKPLAADLVWTDLRIKKRWVRGR